MRLTSLIRDTDSSRGNDSRLSRNSETRRGGSIAAFFFAATLALAPAPAFAQHGGGGGGSHGGGGGMGGGSHAGGGGGGTHATASSGSGSVHAPVSTAGASGGNSGTSANHPVTNGTASGGKAAPQPFAAGNNTWQEPPVRGMHGTTVATTGTNVRGSARNPRSAVGPPHIPIVPRRPIGFSPFFPFYPGFGFGFGGGFYGAFGPCDPFWGCYGYGYGHGFGYGGLGYGYYGGSFGSGYGADLSYSGTEDNSPSEDWARSSDTPASLLAQAPETSQEQEASNSAPIAKPVTAVLYLKDGSSYAVTDYWLADGKIHYVTSYGGENSIDQSALDLQRTVNENASQGLTFTLRPASSATDPQ
jgi:hypothetical protein